MAASATDRLQAVEVDYEYSRNLPALIERLQLSIVASTYQAGRLVTIGSKGGELQVGFSQVPQAMGLTRTPSGLAVCSEDQVWKLEANQEIASKINPDARHDIAFLARSCHLSGPVMAHDLAWCNGELLMVNTLFNCVASVGGGLEFHTPVAATVHQRPDTWRSLPHQRPGPEQQRRCPCLRHGPRNWRQR